MAWAKETNIKGPPGDVQEAPLDGQQYARQDATWVPVDPETSWDEVTGKPDTFPPTTPIPWDDVSGKPATFPPTVPIPWTDVSGKPSTFPPASHQHPQNDVLGLIDDLALKAPLASPTFTGDPKAPTPATGDNDTSIATTAYVKANLATIVGGAIISDTPPASPQPGQLWYESDSANTYIWYQDTDSAQWVQQNVQPGSAAGLPPDWLSSVPADLSYGFRAAGTPAGSANRFVWNDKADLTGTDVSQMWENGQTVLGSPNIALPAAANYRSMLTVNGDISVHRGGAQIFNGYYDQPGGTFRAREAGYVGYLHYDATGGGGWALTGTAAAVAAGAAASTPTLMALSPEGSPMFYGSSMAYGGTGNGTYLATDATNTVVTFGAGAYLQFLKASGNYTLYAPGGNRWTSRNSDGAFLVPGSLWADNGTTFGLIHTGGNARYFQFATGVNASADGAGNLAANSTGGVRWTSMNVDGNFHVPTGAYKPGGGSWTASSDIRIKDVHGPYEGGLAEVLALNPVRYSYKGNVSLKAPEPEAEQQVEPQHQQVLGKEFIGLVAQEAEIPMPELVSLTSGFIEGVEVTDLRSLDSGPLIFALVNAVKELSARVEELEARLV